MRVMVIALVMACSDPAAPPDAFIEPDPLPVAAAPCADFQLLFTNPEPNWRHDPPYIIPAYADVIVTGADFVSYEGVTEPQPNDTALVHVGKVYHFTNGAHQLGAVGRRMPDGLCEWAIAL